MSSQLVHVISVHDNLWPGVFNKYREVEGVKNEHGGCAVSGEGDQ